MTISSVPSGAITREFILLSLYQVTSAHMIPSMSNTFINKRKYLSIHGKVLIIQGNMVKTVDIKKKLIPRQLQYQLYFEIKM